MANTTQTMVVLNQTSIPWAQEEDWVKHRTTITELYMKQRRKLEDVKRTMAEEYGFYATLRMYKTRFKKWGLAKNKKPKPVFFKSSDSECADVPVLPAAFMDPADDTESLLGSQDLSLLEITTVAILKFMRYGPGLAEAFINYACTLSQIVLGAAHPLSMLFQKYKVAGPDQFAYCIGTAIQYCVGEYCLGGVAHVVSHPMMESYGDMYSELIYHKIFRPAITLSELQHFQNYLQNHVQEQPGRQSILRERVQGLHCRVAWLHFYAGHYQDAAKVVFGMLNEPRADSRVITGCYDILYDIAVAENKDDLALEMIQKAVAASVDAYGHAHCTTVRKMARLESYLRSKGQVQEADKVRSDSEMQLEQICEEIRHSRF
ncbi:hypothetical protein E0Z10_g7634 [Xylaria hypoxylon]|uniref:Clr5 domain-containing protein n=1 Tax=Xylaria hypoxylon TaxID=37992 RepID=A0A4Z0YDD1_9PEZI|nr:hypothetical protein E0Z10_g7634 [Xylaria hypoxylon]